MWCRPAATLWSAVRPRREVCALGEHKVTKMDLTLQRVDQVARVRGATDESKAIGTTETLGTWTRLHCMVTSHATDAPQRLNVCSFWIHHSIPIMLRVRAIVRYTLKIALVAKRSECTKFVLSIETDKKCT